MQPDSPVAPDALRQIEALLYAMETCHICQTALLLDDGPTHCESGCSYDCDEHEEPGCTPISMLHQQAKRSLLGLAQQLQEGERANAAAEVDGEDIDRLTRELSVAREALAVAEGALDCAGCYCTESHQCSSCKAIARIAALKGAPTGTPKGEAE